MSGERALKGSEWQLAVEVLHLVQNVLASRAHYPEGHPAIQRAVAGATEGLERLLATVPELVVALADGEYVVCDRPMPGLREHLGMLASSMERHQVECMVFVRGVSAAECEHLARSLMLPADVPGRMRQLAQLSLVHILLRFVELARSDEDGHERHAAEFRPQVQRVLDHVLRCFAEERLADVPRIRALASRIASACAGRAFTLLSRCWERGADDQAAHATNVAMMSASMALAAHAPDAQVVELTAAAMLHDVGTLLSPLAIRDLPEPMIDDAQRVSYRHHPLAGAMALLATGCPPLWVAVALEHHRGVDGGGYPELSAAPVPHELVRMVSLCAFFDRKRTLLAGRIDDPDQALAQASHLETSYFGAPLVPHFLRTLGVYPPGTIVELSDRQTGLVTGASPHDPLRPMVRLLTGPDAGKQVDLRARNLREGRHELSITQAILPPLAVAPREAEAKAEPPEPPPPAPPPPPPVAPRLARGSLAPPPAAGDAPLTILARLGGGHAVPVLVPGHLRGAGLDHRQGFLLTFIDGQVALDELLDATGLPQAEVLELLDGLVRAGVVRMR